MRRPLLGIVFCFLAGIAMGFLIGGMSFLTALIFAALALLGSFSLHCIAEWRYSVAKICPHLGLGQFSLQWLFNTLANILIYLAVFLTGYLALDLRINSPSEADIARLMDRPREGVEIIGVISDDPALRKGRDESLYWSFNVQTEAINRIGHFQKARGDLRATMPYDGAKGRPCYGERWRLSGALTDNVKMAALHDDSNGGWFPSRFSFQVQDQSGSYLLAGAPRWSLLRGCYILREKCAGYLALGIDHRPEVISILHALVLGRQNELPANRREAFVATGTYHIFAISGQHVAIIAMFIIVILQAYGMSSRHWFYCLAPVLIVFTIMTGMSASALRGCLMALMCFLGPLLMRRTDISSAMAFAALIITAFDTLQLFQAGFILSFGIVAGLIVLCPPLIATAGKWTAPDPWLSGEERPLARNARAALRWCVFMLVASCAAWMVSTPLIARWFNLVSLVALAANLIVIPLATLVLLAGCLSILFGAWWPLAAKAFNFANVAIVSLMTGVTDLMAKMPWGHIYIKSPPVWFILFWFTVLVVWRIFYQRKRIALIAFAALVAGSVVMWRLQRNEWEIHVLNSGKNAVCFVNSFHDGSMLLNTGPRYQARSVLDYLHQNGVNRIKALVCPWPDADHIGAAEEIMAALPTDQVWCNATNRIKGLMKKTSNKPAMRRIEAGHSGSGIWRVQSRDNNLSFDLLCHGDRSNMAARIVFPRSGSLPDIELMEAANSEYPVNSTTQMSCRIICRPASEQRAWRVGDQWPDALVPGKIVLGPGQGVRLSPGNGRVTIKRVSFGR